MSRFRENDKKNTYGEVGWINDWVIKGIRRGEGERTTASGRDERKNDAHVVSSGRNLLQSTIAAIVVKVFGMRCISPRSGVNELVRGNLAGGHTIETEDAWPSGAHGAGLGLIPLCNVLCGKCRILIDGVPGVRTVDIIDNGNERVILEIGTDGDGRAGSDVKFAKRSLVADAREEENLRSTKGTSGENGFLCGGDVIQRLSFTSSVDNAIDDGCTSRRGISQFGDLGIDEDVKVGAAARVIVVDETSCSAPSLTTTSIRSDIGDTDGVT